MVGGWVSLENEINANSAFNYVGVEVEAELGNNTTIQGVKTSPDYVLTTLSNTQGGSYF